MGYVGAMEATEMSSALFEFLENNDLDSTDAPKTRSASSVTEEATPLPTQALESEEDDALTAAIRMSLGDIPPTPPSVQEVSYLLDNSNINAQNENDSFVAPSAQQVIYLSTSRLFEIH